MPCGGIYPIKGTWVEGVPRDESKPEHRCWTCGRLGALHFCDEWDTFIHARCAILFLQTDEGECVISHGHVVELDFSVEGVNDANTDQTTEVGSNPDNQ